PILMSALGGPQALLGWLIAVIVTIPDGLVWSELGAAMPGSGGSYVYLREAYGRDRFGRLVAFLFIWQFILSGPLEIASGYITRPTSGQPPPRAGSFPPPPAPASPPPVSLTAGSRRSARSRSASGSAPSSRRPPSSSAAPSTSMRRARSTFHRERSTSRWGCC